MKESCLTCSKWITCTVPGKAAKYLCADFKEQDDIMPLNFLDNLDSVKFKSEKEEQEFYDGKELQLTELLENYLDSKAPVPKDLKVDDGHIPHMKNFYEFCFDKKWGFRGIVPFPRQLWVGLKLFGEICPICTKPKYFNNIKKIKVNYDPKKLTRKLTLLEHGVCPKCNARKSELVKSGKLQIYTELGAIFGQRSGKSIVVSFLVVYLTHIFLKLQKPADLFLGVPNQYLTGTVVAPNMKDCMTLLWRPILDAMADSPWFDEYHKLLKECNKKYGVEAFKVKDTYIDYGFRKIVILPQAANLRTLRGRSRWFYGCDELDYFDATEEGKSKITISGKGVWDALNTSMATVQQAAHNLLMQGWDAIPTGIAFNISSPCINPGVLSQLIAKPVEGLLALRLPTWEVNPKMPKDSPIIKKAYDVDAVQAETNFGANPPSSGSHFINPQFKLGELFGNLKNRVDYQYDHVKDNLDGLERLYRFSRITGLNSSNYNYGSVLSIDCGFSNNGFSIVIGNREKVKDNLKLEFPVIIDVLPEVGKSVIHFPKMVNDTIERLIAAFNVKVVVADRWQSIFLLHNLKTKFPHLVICQQYSVSYEDFMLFKSFILAKAVGFPKLEIPEKQCIELDTSAPYPHYFDIKPAAHLYHQIITVQDKAYTVDKGENRTDDIFRAIVLNSVFLMHKKAEEWLFHKAMSTGKKAVISDGSGGSGGGAIKGKNGKGLIG